jgi:hypothetical protein
VVPWGGQPVVPWGGSCVVVSEVVESDSILPRIHFVASADRMWPGYTQLAAQIVATAICTVAHRGQGSVSPTSSSNSKNFDSLPS